MTEALKLQSESPESDDVNEDTPFSSISVTVCKVSE
jgi:hypothetical protein